MQDNELIKGCLQQDRNAQRMLYDKYSGQMYSICLRYCREQVMAKEALQNGFIKVFQYLKTYRNDCPLGGWIRKIIIRAALDQLGIEKKRSLLFSSVELSNDIDSAVEWHEKMTYDELLKLINSIPEGYKLVFCMYVLDDMSHAEIARELGIEESTSRSQLKKARNYIQKLMLDLKFIQ